MSARPLMIQGTGSFVGKSIIVAGLCRLLKQDGFQVAPFKAQNMALNSFITPEGGEMGRAQVVQAEAAGLAPHVDMNPILLKPNTDIGAQVIIQGKVFSNMNAGEYHRFKKEALQMVMESYARLAKKYQVIVKGRFPQQDSPLTIDADLDNRSALTHVHYIKYDPLKDRTLLEVRIETGRKHQIRRHLSSIGFPVAGDRMYGQGPDTEDLQLTACYLSFICPVSGEVREYRLPEDLTPHL